MEHGLAHPTSYNKMGASFVTEADTLIDIVCEIGLNKIYLNIVIQ